MNLQKAQSHKAQSQKADTRETNSYFPVRVESHRQTTNEIMSQQLSWLLTDDVTELPSFQATLAQSAKAELNKKKKMLVFGIKQINPRNKYKHIISIGAAFFIYD